MRKITMFNMMSLDGYFADARGSIDWHVTDDEFNRMAVENIQRYDTILFGRVTYQLFENFWPRAAENPKTSKEDVAIARKINDMHKIVFSKTLHELGWENAKVLADITPEAVLELKNQPGKDIVIYGSGSVVRQLAGLGLIDEYHVMINPVLLGAGKQLFAGVPQQKLTLIDRTLFESGNLLLIYQPESGAQTGS
jgi:dihydrofolate reductase